MVMVIYSPGFGAGLWGLDSELHRIDLKAVNYVMNREYNKAWERLTELSPELFRSDQGLCLEEVEPGSYWRVTEYDGAETVEVFNPFDPDDDWIKA